ncbi:MAG: hypothetical protein KME57_08390 [Scytonema hyalinum WJT4-NPBG1]|nr:hypothetical protein [Scytonema hyalinum WJT4-NPBG1]
MKLSSLLQRKQSLAQFYSGSRVECNTSRNKNHRWTRQCVAEPALKTEKPVQVTGVGVPPVVQSSVSAGDSNCRTDGHR